MRKGRREEWHEWEEGNFGRGSGKSTGEKVAGVNGRRGEVEIGKRGDGVPTNFQSADCRY